MIAEKVREPLLAEAARIVGEGGTKVRVLTSLFLARAKGAPGP
ncbi:hypothetical protein [Streptomyces rectiverticillatus]|nr:hypothetical protein [Streptomyces rectiverticillatus]